MFAIAAPVTPARHTAFQLLVPGQPPHPRLPRGNHAGERREDPPLQLVVDQFPGLRAQLVAEPISRGRQVPSDRGRTQVDGDRGPLEVRQMPSCAGSTQVLSPQTASIASSIAGRNRPRFSMHSAKVNAGIVPAARRAPVGSVGGCRCGRSRDTSRRSASGSAAKGALWRRARRS